VNPSTAIHRPSTRRRWLALILIVMGIAAFVLWPRPALELYTTPPLDSKGTRIQLLIPRGWYLKSYGRLDSIDSGYADFSMAQLKTWYPEWIRRFLKPDEECGLAVSVHAPSPDLEVGMEISSVRLLRVARLDKMVSSRHGTRYLYIVYSRRDSERFSRTYRQILDSVKVL